MYESTSLVKSWFHSSIKTFESQRSQNKSLEDYPQRNNSAFHPQYQRWISMCKLAINCWSEDFPVDPCQVMQMLASPRHSANLLHSVKWNWSGFDRILTVLEIILVLYRSTPNATNRQTAVWSCHGGAGNETIECKCDYSSWHKPKLCCH